MDQERVARAESARHTQRMNVFVLCTGRCGSMTFIRACEQITNFTAGHETRKRLIGATRFAYPDQHIEADNRLSWMLGRLNDAFEANAFYVHLLRDPEAVAQSFMARWGNFGSIIDAYRDGVLMSPRAEPSIDFCRDYVETVTTNIRLFMRDKPQRMEFWIEEAASALPEFWSRIGAEGDMSVALAEFRQRHNRNVPSQSASAQPRREAPKGLLAQFARKIRIPSR